MLISTRTAKIKKQSMNRSKFGVKGKTPSVVLNMFAARVSGRYAWLTRRVRTINIHFVTENLQW
jgi:hypothetical protein